RWWMAFAAERVVQLGMAEQAATADKVSGAGEEANAASNPNTPPERLLELASAYSAAVLQNPAMALLLLSDPETYAKIRAKAEEARDGSLTFVRVKALSREQAVQFSLACAEQCFGVLPAALAADPGDE